MAKGNPILRRLENVPMHYSLAVILLIAFCVRTYVWHYSNWVGLVRHGDGYLFMAQALGEGDWGKYFSHWRWLQPIYPFYLVPMYFFKWDDAIYIFWLHQSLVAGTILFIFLATRRIYGCWCGIAACLVYALHLQIAYWINWAFSDTAFHFHLAIFVYFTLISWEKVKWRPLMASLLGGTVLILTRPDGIPIVASALAVLFYKVLTRTFKPMQAISLVVTVASMITVSVLGFIFANESAREKVLSNIHVAWGLYIGTLPTPTNPPDVDKKLIALFSEGSILSQKDPKGRNQWYWASEIGLQRLKNDPLKFLKIVAVRYIAVIIPSTFRDNPSWRYVLIDRLLSFYLIFGIMGALILRNENRFYTTGLTVIAFSIYTLVSIYQREWDVRVQLSSYTVLLGAASHGWHLIVRAGQAWRKD